MSIETPTLKNVLKTLTAEGELYEKLENGKLRCFACGHRCLIADGLDGICRVRFNRGGKLLVPHGYVGALQLDPVEKKPFFHALPGSLAMSFGMLGCDFQSGAPPRSQDIVRFERQRHSASPRIHQSLGRSL